MISSSSLSRRDALRAGAGIAAMVAAGMAPRILRAADKAGAKAITYDNLTLRAPDFVAEADRAFARQVRAKGLDVDADNPVAPMFQPLRLRARKPACVQTRQRNPQLRLEGPAAAEWDRRRAGEHRFGQP